MRRIAFILSLLTLVAIGVNAPQFVHMALEHPHAAPASCADTAAAIQDQHSCCHDHAACDASSTQPANHADGDCSTCDLLAVAGPLLAHAPALIAAGPAAPSRADADAGRLISFQGSHDAPARAPPPGRA
jgi:hypothetical protein